MVSDQGNIHATLKNKTTFEQQQQKNKQKKFCNCQYGDVNK